LVPVIDNIEKNISEALMCDRGTYRSLVWIFFGFGWQAQAPGVNE